jgi:hypothetical protein
MTFNEAVAYLTRDGGSLLDELELIADEIHLARERDESIDVPAKSLAAYRLVVAKMRPLFT